MNLQARIWLTTSFGTKAGLFLVAEWIHFTLFGIILPTIKLKVYTFWGL